MNLLNRGIQVAEGTWLFDGSVRCAVAIVRRDILYGTGDSEDPPHIADDQHVETFEILYESPGDPNRFNAGGGQYRTLDEARAAAESACGPSLRWLKT